MNKQLERNAKAVADFEKLKESKEGKAALLFFRNLAGVLVIGFSILMISSNWFAAILFFISGLLLVSWSRNKIQAKLKLNAKPNSSEVTNFSVGLIVIGFIAFLFFSGDSDDVNKEVDKDEVGNIESEIQPIDEPKQPVVPPNDEIDEAVETKKDYSGVAYKITEKGYPKTYRLGVRSG